MFNRSFPCFRSCGPINCPKNKLPMPRDLWYRLVYSQLVEEQGKRKRPEGYKDKFDRAEVLLVYFCIRFFVR